LSDTLVVPIDEERIGAGILPEVKEETNGKHTITTQLTKSTSARSNYTNMMGLSPFPALDKFINKLAVRKGVNGAIRAWSIDTPHSDDLSCSVITYQIKENRWCENIKRCHKSNNIMWRVSIGECKYWQACHDPECRMMSFRGEMQNLPQDVRITITEILIAKEVQVSDSFEKALLDLSLSRPPKMGGASDVEESFEQYCKVDESFEQALLDLNLSGDKFKLNDSNDIKDQQQPSRIECDVDEEFEKALMGLNLNESKQPQSQTGVRASKEYAKEDRKDELVSESPTSKKVVVLAIDDSFDVGFSDLLAAEVELELTSNSKLCHK